MEPFLNKLFADYIAFNDFNFSKKAHLQSLNQLMDLIVVNILGKKKVTNESDIEKYIGNTDDNKKCLDSLKMLQGDITRNLNDKKTFLYANYGAFYEFSFSTDEEGTLKVKVNLYPKSCYYNLMI